MRRFPAPIACLTACLLVAAASSGVHASSFDFLFTARYATDDHQLFLNLAVSDSGYGRDVIEPVLPHLHHVHADLPVLLFLAENSRWSLSAIATLRGEGHTWAVIFAKVGVPVGALFHGIDRDPGPPYGKAWGHWKKRDRGLALTDEEICGLVEVQLGHRLSGVSSFELAHGHAREVSAVVADKRASHGKPGRHGDHGKGKSKSR